MLLIDKERTKNFSYLPYPLRNQPIQEGEEFLPVVVITTANMKINFVFKKLNIKSIDVPDIGKRLTQPSIYWLN